MAEIEHIDDEADGAGINFVKIDDKQMAKEYGVFALPGVVFFKMSSKDPVIYAGNVSHRKLCVFPILQIFNCKPSKFMIFYRHLRSV